MPQILDLQAEGRQYATVSEAAEYFRVHPQTIRKWLDSGLLHRFQACPRGRVRISIRSMQSFEAHLPRTD